MPRLSKSKLLAFRQCERRLWLELHRPGLRQDDDASLAAFSAGHQVGDLARQVPQLSQISQLPPDEARPLPVLPPFATATPASAPASAPAAASVPLGAASEASRNTPATPRTLP